MRPLATFPNGNVTKITYASGYSITYAYDANNRLTSYVDQAGYTFAFEYDPEGNLPAQTDGNGNVTKYTYDGLNRQTGRTNAEGNPSSRTYDADGRLIQTVDEEGAETHYVYDDCNRLIKMTDALGNATTYTYTDRGDVATETDAEGYAMPIKTGGGIARHAVCRVLHVPPASKTPRQSWHPLDLDCGLDFGQHRGNLVVPCKVFHFSRQCAGCFRGRLCSAQNYHEPKKSLQRFWTACKSRITIQK